MPHRILRKKTNRGKIGEVPGSLVIDDDAIATTFETFVYDEESIEEYDELIAPASGRVTWLNVIGLGDADALMSVSEHFDIHPLVMEDVANVVQRPRAEWYNNGIYCVIKRFDIPPPLMSEQISFFLGEGFVVTFQERPGDCFDPVRERLRHSRGRIRSWDADYLFYALLDAVVDSYFPLLEAYEDRFEELENLALEDDRLVERSEIYSLRNELRELRRALWPVRELMTQLVRIEGFTSPKVQPFLRDAHDHAVSINDELDSMREATLSLIDFLSTEVGNRMNEIMKVLTIVSSVFIPLSFLAGLYGMNFNTEHPANLPELSFSYGYPTLLVVMLVIVIGMVLFFRKKEWL